MLDRVGDGVLDFGLAVIRRCGRRYALGDVDDLGMVVDGEPYTCRHRLVETDRVTERRRDVDRQNLRFRSDAHISRCTAALTGDQCRHAGAVAALLVIEVLSAIALPAGGIGSPEDGTGELR